MSSPTPYWPADAASSVSRVSTSETDFALRKNRRCSRQRPALLLAPLRCCRLVEANLFYRKSSSRNKSRTCRRFATAAEAIRFAVEELTRSVSNGCKLEFGDLNYFGSAIVPFTTTPISRFVGASPPKGAPKDRPETTHQDDRLSALIVAIGRPDRSAISLS